MLRHAAPTGSAAAVTGVTPRAAAPVTSSADTPRVVASASQTVQTLAHLRRARDLIDRDYAEPLDVPTMAARALMSPAHFSRQFRAAYGETPYSYLMTRRIERAMALLRGGDLSVTDVCMAVGCTSLGSFSTPFTELVGETPERLPGARPRGRRRRCPRASRRPQHPTVQRRPSRIREAPAGDAA